MAVNLGALICHSGRLVAAAVLSIVTFAILLVVIRTWSELQGVTLLAIPLSMAPGLLLIGWWYKRDAYPISLCFCGVMFFLLRWVHDPLQRLLNT